MATAVMREEFEGRVGALEAEVEGEKLVTRHILEQSRKNGDDIAAIRTRLARLEDKVDGIDRKFGGLDRKVDQIDRTMRDMVKDLPAMIAGTMREVMADRDRKR